MSNFFRVEILDSETILRIHFKLFLIYFSIDKVIKISLRLEKPIKDPEKINRNAKNLVSYGYN